MHPIIATPTELSTILENADYVTTPDGFHISYAYDFAASEYESGWQGAIIMDISDTKQLALCFSGDTREIELGHYEIRETVNKAETITERTGLFGHKKVQRERTVQSVDVSYLPSGWHETEAGRDHMGRLLSGIQSMKASIAPAKEAHTEALFA